MHLNSLALRGFPSFGSPSFLKQAVVDAIETDVFAETGAPKGASAGPPPLGRSHVRGTYLVWGAMDSLLGGKRVLFI